MRVEYKATIHPPMGNNWILPGYTVATIDSGYVTYEKIRHTACCSDMKVALEKGVIKFGEFEYGLNKSKTMNIFLCRPYLEGISWEAYSIFFCPFCKTKIETVEVERVKLIPEIKKKTIEETVYKEVRLRELKDA